MAANYREVLLPQLPSGFVWSLPEANGVQVSRVILHSTSTTHRMSIYFDTTCAAGCMYDRSQEPPKPIPYVECYDLDGIMDDELADAGIRRFRIFEEQAKFAQHIRRWCKAATARLQAG